MNTVTWPDPALFRALMRHPEQVLRDPELSAATIAWDERGDQAVVWAGSQATVVRAICPDRTSYAIRLMMRKNLDAQDRYETLSRHLAGHQVPTLARSSWLPEGLALGGATFPLLKMDWIQGSSLEEWLTGRLRSESGPAEIAVLAQHWRQVCADLIASGVSHGDIHAGNTLVQTGTAGPAIRLVDYDNIWVPGMRAPRGERGHPAYQHPACDTDAGLHRDAFPHTLVYLNLMAVAAQPVLWAERGGADDILLLQHSDLVELDRPIWRRLAQSPDPAVVRLTAVVSGWLATTSDAFLTLDEAATDAESPGCARPAGPNVWRGVPVPPTTATPAASPRPARAGTQQWPGATGRAGSSPSVAPTGPAHRTGHTGIWTVLFFLLILAVLWYLGRR